MELNKDYHYHTLTEFCRNNGYTLYEYGKQSAIGESFIVLTQGVIAISFVLTGYNDKSGSVFTCIYSDLNLTDNSLSL